MTSPKEGWEQRFFAHFGRTFNISKSARAAGVTRQAVQKRRDHDPEFAEGFEEAKQAALDVLEQEAHRRARQKSDLLMIFMLKSNRPDPYNPPNREEVSGPGGGPQVTEIAYVNDWRNPAQDPTALPPPGAADGEEPGEAP